MPLFKFAEPLLITEERAIEWFSAIEAAELDLPIDAEFSFIPAHSMFTDTESSVVGTYLAALKNTLGDSVTSVLSKARQYQS